MNLENSIKDIITKKLEDGFVEKAIAEQLENGVKHALKDLLGSFGDVTKVIEEKVKSVMVPYLEQYDYSKYITKLDSVLAEVLQNSSLVNKQILENFRDLMIPIDENMKMIKLTDLFEKWEEYVRKNVETDGLEIDFDDRPTYEWVEVSFEVEDDADRDWSSFESALVTFECDHDENMNFAFRISKWKSSREDAWAIDYKTSHNINSLRNLNSFEVLMMKLSQSFIKLEVDERYGNDEVVPDAEPEPTWE